MALNIGEALQNITSGGVNTTKAKETTRPENSTPIARLTVEPQEFSGLSKTELTTSQRFAEKINGMFATVFRDYIGCIIYPNDQIASTINQFQTGATPANNQNSMSNCGNMSVYVYFTDQSSKNTDQQIANLEKLNISNTRNYPDYFNSVIRLNESRVYDLTKETKEILSHYIDPRFMNRDKSVRWNDVSYEVTEHLGYMSSNKRICVAVRLDLFKIIKELYKIKDENGHYYDYSVSIVRPITPPSMGGTPATSNYLLSITRIDNSSVEELCKEIGMIGGQSSIPMVRAY